MAGFPDEQLELTAQAAWGADLTAAPETWAWSDLTCTHPSNPAVTISRLVAEPITIQRGIAVGATNQQTTSATVQLLNHDGALTPELATSPFWPYVDAGTPFRIRMRTRTTAIAADVFARTTSNGWGTADTGQLWTTTGTAADWSTNGSLGRIAIPAVNTTRRAMLPASVTPRDVDVVYDSSLSAVATGAPCSTGVVARYVDASNHLWCVTEFALGGAVNLRVRPVVAADFATNLTSNTSTGVTYTAAAMIRTRVQVVGDRVRMKVWPAANAEPATWHIDVRQTTYLTAGRIGLQMLASFGNTNTLPITVSTDNITITQPPYDRVEGYIANIRPSFLPLSDGTTWSTVLVDVGGVGTRLEKNQSPDYSPVRRSVQLSDPPPIAYWPGEDAEGALSVASAFPQQLPMQVTGPAVFSFTQALPAEQYLSRYGTKPLVSVAAGVSLTGTVPYTAVDSEWAVSTVGEFLVTQIPLTSMRIMEWETAGSSINRWALIGTNPGYFVRAYNDAAGTTTDLNVYTTLSFTGQNTYTVEAVQNGGNIDVKLFVNSVQVGPSSSLAGSLKAVTRVTGNPDRTNTTASVSPLGIRYILGHFRVLDETSVRDLPFYTDPDTGTTVQAGDAWYLESAHRRIDRLCDEERVPFQWVGNPTGPALTILNAQRDGSFTDLITQAADSESGGLLYEKRFGYEYLPRSQRYNRPVALTIDMTTYRRSGDTDPEDVLVPTLDTRATNYSTVTRTNGSSASDAADEAYRKRRGTIAEEAQLDVLTDDVLPDHASWRTHVSVDYVGAKYPSIPLDLAANPDLIDDYLGCEIGSRVQRTNQPTVAGIGVIDQVIEGFSETISPTSWEVTLAAGPGSVWDVAIYDDLSRRKDSKSTVTNTSYAAGVSPIVFKTTNVGDLWSTTGTPYDVVCAGERMTVTAMGAASGSGPYTQSATVTRAVNGAPKALPAGAPIHLHPDELAYWAL